MYLALTYDLGDDYLERRGEYREEHLALARAARERGELALAGAFTDPADAALLVWSTEDRSVVERFAAQDPYVVNGLVRAWRVREWSVVVGG
ncbi:MAG TPA: YciI-like protein [Actinomycetes bacterium]|nr:YciI-like protein [Actinomycetes bacterium]